MDDVVHVAARIVDNLQMTTSVRLLMLAQTRSECTLWCLLEADRLRSRQQALQLTS